MGEYRGLVKGDRVRVTRVYEGYVGYASRLGADIYPNPDKTGQPILSTKGGTDKFAETVEKLAPPVEVFKPGDRLRRGNYEITLASEGYLQHFSDGVVEYYPYAAGEQASFTSEGYTKVELVEVPF